MSPATPQLRQAWPWFEIAIDSYFDIPADRVKATSVAVQVSRRNGRPGPDGEQRWFTWRRVNRGYRVWRVAPPTPVSLGDVSPEAPTHKGPGRPAKWKFDEVEPGGYIQIPKSEMKPGTVVYHIRQLNHGIIPGMSVPKGVQWWWNDTYTPIDQDHWTIRRLQ